MRVVLSETSIQKESSSFVLYRKVEMLPQILLLLIASTLPLQSTSASPNNSQTQYETTEAYEVYSAILPSEWPWRVAKAKRLVIRSATNGYQMCLRPEKEYEELIGPAISDYERLNQKTWQLQRNFRIEKPYEIITAEELKSTFEQGLEGWKKFYERHPESGGWIELSAVGFNTDKTIAVVYMGHSCGGLCGGGGFHVLQKSEGKWMPLYWKGLSCAWAS